LEKGTIIYNLETPNPKISLNPSSDGKYGTRP
jgi:hypothetical protein